MTTAPDRTVGPYTPRDLAEAQATGLTFVDAPVTGAVPAAMAGTLTSHVSS